MGVSEEARTQFEAWVQKRHGVSIERWHDSGVYKYDNTKRWWECWLAALSHMQPAGEAVSTQPAPVDVRRLRELADAMVPDHSDEEENEFDRGYDQAMNECREMTLALLSAQPSADAGEFQPVGYVTEEGANYYAENFGTVSLKPKNGTEIFAAIAAQREAGEG